MVACVVESHPIFQYLSLNWSCINWSRDWVPMVSLHQTKTAFTIFGTFLEPGDRCVPVHFSFFTFLISHRLSFPFVYLFFISRPRQRNELLCCELSWKKERRRFCRELTKKEKKSLKRFYIFFVLLLNLLSLSI